MPFSTPASAMTKRRYPIPTRKTVPRHEYAPPPRRRLGADPTALTALAFLGLVVVASLVAPLLTPYDPLQMSPAEQLQPPSLAHPAGTDLFGRDVAARLLYGGRLTLGIGVVAVLIGALPGTLLGLLAGYYGRWVDRLIGWFVDVILAFPSILLALTIIAALGTGAANVILAVGIAGIPHYTRLVRGHVLSARRAPYVRAAVTVGCTDWRILSRHILPGVQPPTPEWGAMLNEGRGYLRDAPWLTMVPGLAIALTVLAINLLGDALRDALDPRLKDRR